MKKVKVIEITTKDGVEIYIDGKEPIEKIGRGGCNDLYDSIIRWVVLPDSENLRKKINEFNSLDDVIEYAY